MNTATDAHKTNGNGATPDAHAEKANEILDAQAEQELLFKLKGAVDQNGRYSYRLSDFAIGYAAGRGVPVLAARAAIEKKFAGHFGVSPRDYLEQHYQNRRGMAQENGGQNAPARSFGRGR